MSLVASLDRSGRREATTAPRNRAPRTLVAVALVLAAGAVLPARADTASELQDARGRLADLRADLNGQVAAWQAAEARLAESRDEAAAIRGEIGDLEVEFRQAQRTFDLRAHELFMSGGDPTFEALLTAESATELLFSNCARLRSWPPR